MTKAERLAIAAAIGILDDCATENMITESDLQDIFSYLGDYISPAREKLARDFLIKMMGTQ
jgi:hypothetical protein